MQGAFTVWGGHKGSGIAMVIQLLGMLAGQQLHAASLRDCGFFLMVINPELLIPADEYRRTVTEFAQRLRQTRPANPAFPVRIPFDRSATQRESRRRNDKIEVSELVHEQLMHIARSRTPANS